MKKIFFTVTAVLAGTVAMAQGPSIGFNVGYGFATPSEVLGTETEPGRQTNIYGTLGSGFNVGVTPGYMLTEHFGLELGFNYFMGAETTVNKFTNNFGVNELKARSNQFRVLPNLVLTSAGEVMSVYMKAGLVVPVAGKTMIDINDTGTSPLVGAYTRKSETRGQASLGFSGSLGGSYNVSEKLSLFAELSSVNLRIKSKKNSVTESTSQGQNNFGTMTTADKETEYEDEVNTALQPDQNSPTKALATKHNFGAVFLNIGIKYNF